jgi:ABC-type glycerol-3-phosphate transport system substrate-binding protein
MKIRGLLAGLLVAAAVSGCTGSATAPEVHTTPAAFNEAPPPPDTTTTTTSTNRGGGIMGTGT